ncbi:MAG: signal peptidase II [Candidatus Omnitrophota bacterium]|jgi:signal peptidase II|nr:MAG: signal peptidase II [Candidatus Omnitrophota bacterium]
MNLLLSTILIIILDQATKFLAIKSLSLHQSVVLIPGIFHITLVLNRGAAFGILKNQTLLFISSAVLAVTLIMLDFFRKRASNYLYDISLSLIAAGAIGNLIDRLFRGHVVDFLDFRVWPVFNIADTSVTIGAILLGYVVLLQQKDTPARTQ